MMKVAIIGAGWAARRHLGVLVAEPDIDIVGYVSPHGKPLQAGGLRWDGAMYQDINTLLERQTVDAAWICVPPGEHGTIENALLDREIPFFVEKPLSADRHTGEQIAEAVARKNVIAGVAYHWRAMDTLPAIRQKLAEIQHVRVGGLQRGHDHPEERDQHGDAERAEKQIRRAVLHSLERCLR